MSFWTFGLNKWAGAVAVGTTHCKFNSIQVDTPHLTKMTPSFKGVDHVTLESNSVQL